LNEGSEIDSEIFTPGLEDDAASQSAIGKETSTFPAFVRPVSASEMALSEVILSKRTFIRLFRRSEPGVENQPAGGAGVRAGKVPARESAEGGATVEDCNSVKEV